MDADPELDLTLSDGRESLTYQIAAVEGAVDAWAIREPLAPVTVVLGRAAALERRARFDTLIAERLAAGWVPVDVGPAGAPLGPATPLPADLVLQISHLLEVLERSRTALRGADPTGQLWAACVLVVRQMRRVGIGIPRAWVARAARERRLGELADHAGDLPAALLHYRAALAAHPRVGVRRRLAQLMRHGSMPPDSDTSTRDETHVQPLVVKRARCIRSNGRQETTTMAKKRPGKIQLVCRIDPALNAQVRPLGATPRRDGSGSDRRRRTMASSGQPISLRHPQYPPRPMPSLTRADDEMVVSRGLRTEPVVG